MLTIVLVAGGILLVLLVALSMWDPDSSSPAAGSRANESSRRSGGTGSGLHTATARRPRDRDRCHDVQVEEEMRMTGWSGHDGEDEFDDDWDDD